MVEAAKASGGIFFGWRVVAAAFVFAVFAWGVAFYGPSVFLHALHQSRDWPISLISAAITAHFLLSALMVTYGHISRRRASPLRHRPDDAPRRAGARLGGGRMVARRSAVAALRRGPGERGRLGGDQRRRDQCHGGAVV